MKQVSNIFFLGRKDYQILPRYSCWFNVAMIPFKTGPIAKATSPLKLFEYMSSGKQVVCTRDMIECAGFAGVYLSKSKSDFCQKIKLALARQQSVGLLKLIKHQAQSNTWQKRASQISDKIQQIDKHQNIQATILRFRNFLANNLPPLRQLIQERDQLLLEKNNLKIEIFKRKLILKQR